MTDTRQVLADCTDIEQLAVPCSDSELGQLGIEHGKPVTWRALRRILTHHYRDEEVEVTAERIVAALTAVVEHARELMLGCGIHSMDKSRIRATFQTSAKNKYVVPSNLDTEHFQFAENLDTHRGDIGRCFQGMALWKEEKNRRFFTAWAIPNYTYLFFVELTGELKFEPDAFRDWSARKNAISTKMKEIVSAYATNTGVCSESAKAVLPYKRTPRQVPTAEMVGICDLDRYKEHIYSGAKLQLEDVSLRSEALNSAVRGRMLTLDTRSVTSQNGKQVPGSMPNARESDLSVVQEDRMDNAMVALYRRMLVWPQCLRYLLLKPNSDRDESTANLAGYVSGAPLDDSCIITEEQMKDDGYNIMYRMVHWDSEPRKLKAFMFASVRLDPTMVDISKASGAEQKAFEAAEEVLITLRREGWVFDRVYMLTHQNFTRTWIENARQTKEHKNQEEKVTSGTNSLPELDENGMVARLHFRPWCLKDGYFKNLKGIYQNIVD